MITKKFRRMVAGYLVFSSPVLTTNTNSVVDISNLTSGYHKLSIFADGIYNVDNDFIYVYNSSFSPIYFSVNYLPTTPTPAPTSTPTCNPTSTQPTQTNITVIMVGNSAFVSICAIYSGDTQASKNR